MKTKLLKIDTIICDYGFYPRSQIDEVTARQYADDMAMGANFPPIQVCSKTLRVIDGFTRLRAAEKCGKEEIECTLVDVVDDQDFFSRAVAANTHHGKRYTPFDVRHIIQRSRELGMEVDKICGAVEITPAKYEDIVKGFASSRGSQETALKRTIRHMAGKKLTKRQTEANKKLSGMSQIFYVNQLIELIEADLLVVEDEALIARLSVLNGLLTELLHDRAA